MVRGVLYGYAGDDSDVIVPDGITKISSFAFQDCEDLTSVRIPDSVAVFANRSVMGCKNLKHIYFTAATELEENAFFWGNGDFTIHAPEGSPAATYAQEAEIDFEAC